MTKIAIFYFKNIIGFQFVPIHANSIIKTSVNPVHNAHVELPPTHPPQSGPSSLVPPPPARPPQSGPSLLVPPPACSPPVLAPPAGPPPARIFFLLWDS
jgi:hypothetical protein